MGLGKSKPKKPDPGVRTVGSTTAFPVRNSRPTPPAPAPSTLQTNARSSPSTAASGSGYSSAHSIEFATEVRANSSTTGTLYNPYAKDKFGRRLTSTSTSAAASTTVRQNSIATPIQTAPPTKPIATLRPIPAQVSYEERMREAQEKEREWQAREKERQRQIQEKERELQRQRLKYLEEIEKQKRIDEMRRAEEIRRIAAEERRRLEQEKRARLSRAQQPILQAARTPKHPYESFQKPSPKITGDDELSTDDDRFDAEFPFATGRTFAAGIGIERIVEFREMSRTSWIHNNDPPGALPSPNVQSPTLATALPSGPVALYYVREKRADRAILAAVHIELHMPDRPDLAQVILLGTSKNSLDLRGVELTEQIFLGDLILVQEMVFTGPTEVEVGGRSGPLWTVASYQIASRTVLEERLSVEANDCETNRLECEEDVALSIEGHVGVAYKRKEDLPIDHHGDAVFLVDAFVPSKILCCFTGKPLNNSSKSELLAIFRNLPATPTIDATVIKLLPAPFDLREALTRREKLASVAGSDEEVVCQLYRGFAAAIPAISYIGNYDQDTACEESFFVEQPEPLLVSFVVKSIETDERKTSHRVFHSKTATQKKAEMTAEVVHNRSLQNWQQGRGVWINMAHEVRVTGTIKKAFNVRQGRKVVVSFDSAAESALVSNSVRNNRGKRYPIELFRNTIGFDMVTDIYTYGSSHMEKMRKLVEKIVDSETAMQIIDALYGGDPIMVPRRFEGTYLNRSVKKNGQVLRLTDEQLEVLKLVDLGLPAIVVRAAFGSGKTFVTSVAIAHECTKDEKWHVTVAQSNNAVANAVYAAAELSDYKQAILRIISPNNLSLQEIQTQFDLPELIKNSLENYRDDRRRGKSRASHMEQEIINKFLNVEQFDDTSPMRFNLKALQLFVRLYNPRRIFATTATLLTVFGEKGAWETFKDKVATIAIDEASQLQEATLFALFATFPKARFVLIGDQMQLPPFFPIIKNGKELLRSLAIGNVLERIVDADNVPVRNLFGVYRGHPLLTELLSKHFYYSQLTPAVTALERQSALRSIKMPSPDKPWALLNHQGTERKVGTSLLNPQEADYVVEIVNILRNKFASEDIAVLTFYKAQYEKIARTLEESAFTEGVFVGTVDSSQGREWKIVLVSTVKCDRSLHKSVRPSLNDFFTDPRRINVALSRAMDACIIVGSEATLRSHPKWSGITETLADWRCTQSVAQFIANNSV